MEIEARTTYQHLNDIPAERAKAIVTGKFMAVRLLPGDAAEISTFDLHGEEVLVLMTKNDRLLSEGHLRMGLWRPRGSRYAARLKAESNQTSTYIVQQPGTQAEIVLK